MEKDNLIVLVTGGSGFLGKALLRELLDPQSLLAVSELRVFDLAPPAHHDDPRVLGIKGDIRNLGEVSIACKGADVVIHSAAIVDWGTRSEDEVYSVNYEGTENVLKACEENGVKALVYTSSLDAVFTMKPLRNIDESISYPDDFHNMYCQSKAMSEKLIRSSNHSNLKTCILRPSDIYGEDDPYHIDSLIDMAKTGFYVRLGNGTSKCQHVYSGNVAHAHVLAAKALLDNNEKVNGSVYFLTDGPGSNFFSFFDQIVFGAGYKVWPRNLWLPRWLAYAIGAISEFIAFLIRPIKHYNPKFSRFAVVYTCTDFTFSSEKAKQDFGLVPKYSVEEALKRTIEFYKKG